MRSRLTAARGWRGGGDGDEGEADRWALLVPVLAATLTGVFLWLALFGEAAQRRPVSSVVSLVLMVTLVVVTAALLRLPDLGEAERRAWRALLAAYGMFLASTVLGLLMRAWPELPFTGVRQFLVVGGFGAMVFALTRFPGAPRKRLPRARFVLDAATVFAATTMFLWHYGIAPQLQRGGIGGRLAVLVVVVIGFMAVFVVVLATLALSERTANARGAHMRLVGGVGIVLGLMILSIGRGMGSSRPPELWSLALNWTAITLVISAAVRQRSLVLRRVTSAEVLEHRLVRGLPYAAVAVAFGFLLVAGLREAPLELQGVLVGAAAVGVCVLARQRLLLRENEQLRLALEEQATRDPLTGLRNRRSWEPEAERAIAASRRHGRPLAVLVLDLDGFKSVNDAHGHAVGDEVLRTVGGVLRDGLRASDVAARIGGDEFTVLLPDTTLDDAVRLAELVRARIARSRIVIGNVVVPVTVSIGAAAIPPAASLREVVVTADSAMYRAKHEGRNQVASGSAALGAVGTVAAGG